MKKQIALFALVAAALIAAPSVVLAQGDSTNTPSATPPGAKKHGAVPFKGKVSAVDTAAMTVTLATQTLTITSDTKIMKDGKPATLADITVGEKITGQYKKGEAGKLDATVIHIGGKAKKKTEATEKN